MAQPISSASTIVAGRRAPFISNRCNTSLIGLRECSILALPSNQIAVRNAFHCPGDNVPARRQIPLENFDKTVLDQFHDEFPGIAFTLIRLNIVLFSQGLADIV